MCGGKGRWMRCCVVAVVACIAGMQQQPKQVWTGDNWPNDIFPSFGGGGRFGRLNGSCFGVFGEEACR